MSHMGINVTHRNTAYDSYAVLCEYGTRFVCRIINTAYDSYAVLCTIRVPYYP